MDMNALAESLARKAKAAGKPPGDDAGPDEAHRGGSKGTTGRPKLPSEQRAAIAKKATASRSSAPRRSGK